MTNQPTLDDACAAGLSARGRVDRAADYLRTLGVELHGINHGAEIRNVLVKLLDAHARDAIRLHYKDNYRDGYLDGHRDGSLGDPNKEAFE